jgi:hypothetical protein
MTSRLNARPEHVRIEVRIDGKTQVLELHGDDADQIELELEIEYETRELPPVNLWREREPTGRVRVKLDAFGRKAPREVTT